MTLQEWSRDLTTELRAAGYVVSFRSGFPLVDKPDDMDGTMKLLRWASPSGLPCCKNIYAEGMLFTPSLQNV